MEAPRDATGKTAILLALSPLADDPRVRRMGDHLHAHGWRVIGIGIAGARTQPPAWPVYEASLAILSGPVSPRLRVIIPKMLTRPASVSRREWDVLGYFFRGTCRHVLHGILFLAALIPSVAVSALLAVARPLAGKQSPSAPDSILSQNPLSVAFCFGRFGSAWLAARVGAAGADRELLARHPLLQAMRELALEHGEPALWVANDWLTLSLASEGAKVHGGAYVYDSHEFATHEFAEHRDWRLLDLPLIRTIERRYIRDAKVVTSVSPEITAALRKEYGFSGAAATLRNMPVYREAPFRPVGRPIRALYHGNLMPGRGLEACVESLAHWPQYFVLTIRGPGEAKYLESLKGLAERYGVSHRLTMEPPVPAQMLIEEAMAFDIGLMVLPGHSEHNAYALPNKIFEYLMAGLALCVTDLPSMAGLVRETGAGVLCGDGGPAALTSAIASLSPERINAMRLKALEAARRLHFEMDAEPVRLLYQQVCAGGANVVS